MNDPYSDDRDGNPYAYYEEDTSVRPVYHSGEEPSQQEPRTPLTIRLERVRSFQLLHRTYKLVVMRDHCELVVNDRATEALIPRSEASESLVVRANDITIINENGRKHKFLMEPESFVEIKRARLALWCRENPPTDPLAAYRAVRDLMFDHFFASQFGSAVKICILWLSVFLMLVIPLTLSDFLDVTSLFAVSVILIGTLYYVAIAWLVLKKRRVIFSPAMIAVLILPFVVVFLTFWVFPVILLPAGIAVAPAFWLGIKILAFRGTIRKLREDNAELRLSPENNGQTTCQ